MYIYIYTYICIYVYVYIYIKIYIYMVGPKTIAKLVYFINRLTMLDGGYKYSY